MTQFLPATQRAGGIHHPTDRQMTENYQGANWAWAWPAAESAHRRMQLAIRERDTDRARREAQSELALDQLSDLERMRPWPVLVREAVAAVALPALGLTPAPAKRPGWGLANP